MSAFLLAGCSPLVAILSQSNLTGKMGWAMAMTVVQCMAEALEACCLPSPM